MSRFDDELRRTAAPLAGEPLPEGVLDESLDHAPIVTTGVPWAGASVAVLAVLAVAFVGGPLLGRGGSALVSPSITPPTVLPSMVVRTESPTTTPAPEPTPTSGPTGTATTSASPAPSLGPAVPVAASDEGDGIRITLALDRNHLTYGERVWATVTVENIGVDSVFWAHSSTCVFPAPVALNSGTYEPMQYGRDDWTGDAETLKNISVLEDRPELGFTPEDRVDREGNFGCTTDRIVSEVVPGELLVSRYAWDADRIYGLPATPGAYTATATFRYVGRGSAPAPEDEPAPGDEPSVSVDVSLLVTGSPLDYVTPGEALDRLLEDGRFAAALADLPLERWTGADVVFEGESWTLELRVDSPPQALVARVDAISGEVSGVAVEPREDPYGGPP